MSCPAMYLPSIASTNRPIMWSSEGFFAVLASPMMTDLPPPRSTPQMAAL